MGRNSILLVEDDELDVISVERSLNRLDFEYQLDTAFNGLEALELLNKRMLSSEPLPEVILLDLNMPKMNGIEFLRELRKDARLKPIKVIIMTTSGEENDRREAERLGVSGYLLKPLNFTDNRKRKDSMDAFFQFHLRKLFV